MESAWIALAAERRGVPFAALRAISDPVDQTISFDPSLILDKSGRIRGGALMIELIGRPSRIRELPLLALNFSRSLYSLHKAWKTL